MLRQASTLLLVTVATLLIWAFAEAETLRVKDVDVDLIFEPDAAGDRVVQFVDSPAESVHIKAWLEGSAAALDEAERALHKPLRFTAYDTGVPQQAGEWSLDLSQVLHGHTLMRAKGVTIKKIDPPSARVLVDQLATTEVGVRVDLSGAELDGPAEPRPARVKIRHPASLAPIITEKTVVTATPEPEAIARLVAGRRESLVAVRVSLPPSLAGERLVTCEPPQVDIALTLKSRTASITLPSVPVQVLLAPGEQPNWDIRIEPKDQFLTDVTITGPSEIIKQIADKTLPVVAVLPLSFTELETGKTQSKEAVFSTLPTSLKFEAANRTVPFTVTKRQPAGKAGEPRN